MKFEVDEKEGKFLQEIGKLVATSESLLREFRELTADIEKLRSQFFRHTHHKHGWEKGRVCVETHQYD